MKLPQGQLLRRRVVTDLATVLERALEDELTGYVQLEPQNALLLDSENVGVVTFDQGIPAVVFHEATDSGGTDALTDIAVAGPYRIELYELDSDALADVHSMPALTVEPGTPAEQLAGDADLARRTRDCAPEDRLSDHEQSANEHDAVAAFLDDETRIEEIQEAARQEAQSRAADWGFGVE